MTEEGMDDERRAIADLLRRLSAAAASVLRATLETPDSRIATVAGTANDTLWATCVAHGLARELSLDLDERLRPPGFHPKTYALTDLGRTILPKLLGEQFDER